MATSGQEIASIIKEQIEQFGTSVTMTDVGTVVEVGDGIARVHGRTHCRYNELLAFPNGLMGVAMDLEEETVGATILDRLWTLLLERNCWAE